MEQAKKEIDKSLMLSAFCMRRMGISFERPKNASAHFRQQLIFVLSVCSICYHIFSDVINISLMLAKSPRLEDVVSLFHPFGYGALSIAKIFGLWYKKDVFSQLLHELASIWPTPPLEDEAQAIKNKSLDALRIAHIWYFTMNMIGLWFFNVTPIAVYMYRVLRNEDAQIGYVWVSWYPFDKHETIAHVAVYIFEMFAGQISVWIMVSTDLLFSGMASHISMLLRLLKRRLETLASTPKSDDEYYQEIIENIKLHQRLITYCNDLGDAFSVSNLINIILSSLNICCVGFVIVLLDPFLVVSNKVFLGSALIQIGMLCWYADDIITANADIAAAAYNCDWLRTNARCRRALLFLMQRAQQPIAFTAMKFTDISLVTYSAILTRSYSYFALLSTMYNES